MTSLSWRPASLADREAILDYLAERDATAAIELDDQFEAQAELTRCDPQLYKPGRVEGTREIVVRPNYVMVYRYLAPPHDEVEVLRVLHARRRFP